MAVTPRTERAYREELERLKTEMEILKEKLRAAEGGRLSRTKTFRRVAHLNYEPQASSFSASGVSRRLTLRPIASLGAVPLFSLIGFSRYSKSKLTRPARLVNPYHVLRNARPRTSQGKRFFYNGRSVYSDLTCSRKRIFR